MPVLDIGGFPAVGVPVLVNPRTGFPLALYSRTDYLTAALNSTLTFSVAPLHVTIWKNGTLLYGGGVNYTLVGNIATFTTTLGTGDKITAQYAASSPLLIPAVLGGAPTFATMNPADVPGDASLTFSNGNLTITRSAGVSSAWRSTRSTVSKSSGKWYWEIKNLALGGSTGDGMWGTMVAGDSRTTYPGNVAQDVSSLGWQGDNLPDSTKFKGGTGSLGNATGYGTVAVNGFAHFAIDIDAGKLWVRNSSGSGWAGGGDPAAGTSPTFTFTANATIFAAIGAFSSPQAVTANFGASAFNGTVPTGFNPGLFT